MDKSRIATIGAELKQYGDETQLGFPLSTIKVGELSELISENAGYADTIERQAKELADAEDGHKALEGEIRHRGKRFDLLRLERDALQENVDRLMQERDAALAEIQELHQKTYDDLAAAKAEVERFKADPALSGWFYCQACGERNDVEPKGGRFLGG